MSQEQEAAEAVDEMLIKIKTNAPEEITTTIAETFQEFLDGCGIKKPDIGKLSLDLSNPGLSIPTVQFSFFKFFLSMGPITIDFEWPDISDFLPSFSFPDLPKLPTIPELKLDVNLPQFPKIPEFKWPEIPDIDLPQPFDLFFDLFMDLFPISWPAMPSLPSLPELKLDVNLPQFPKLPPLPDFKQIIISLMLGLRTICSMMPWVDD